MLVLTRRLKEKVNLYIGDRRVCQVVPVEFTGAGLRIGFTACREVVILRDEIDDTDQPSAFLDHKSEPLAARLQVLSSRRLASGNPAEANLIDEACRELQSRSSEIKRLRNLAPRRSFSSR